MFQHFDKYLVSYSKEFKKPFVQVYEDVYFPFMILEENQKIKNVKQFYKLMDQIQDNYDHIFVLDSEAEEVFLSRKDLVKEEGENLNITYIVFDMSSGEEVFKSSGEEVFKDSLYDEYGI